PGNVVCTDVDVDDTNENNTTVGLRLDGRITNFTARRLYVDSKGAVGIDVVRTGGFGTRFFYPTVRAAGAGIALRRACDQNLGVHGATLWYVNLLPSLSGRLLKEVAGAGACTALWFSGLGGAQETSRLEFLNAPNGIGEFRGT